MSNQHSQPYTPRPARMEDETRRALLLRASGRITPENWWHEDVWEAHEATTVALDFVRDGMATRAEEGRHAD